MVCASGSWRTDYEYETVAGYLVPASIRVVKTADPEGRGRKVTSELRFRDWKLNDAVK